MQKKDVLEFFGGRANAATAVGITPQAVGDWPEDLPRRIADRVIAAVVRAGKTVPPAWLTDDPQQPLFPGAEPTSSPAGVGQ